MNGWIVLGAWACGLGCISEIEAAQLHLHDDAADTKKKSTEFRRPQEKLITVEAIARLLVNRNTPISGEGGSILCTCGGRQLIAR